MLLNFTGRVDVKFHKGKVGKEMKKKDKRNQVIMHSQQWKIIVSILLFID